MKLLSIPFMSLKSKSKAGTPVPCDTYPISGGDLVSQPSNLYPGQAQHQAYTHTLPHVHSHAHPHPHPHTHPHLQLHTPHNQLNAFSHQICNPQQALPTISSCTLSTHCHSQYSNQWLTQQCTLPHQAQPPTQPQIHQQQQQSQNLYQNGVFNLDYRPSETNVPTNVQFSYDQSHPPMQLCQNNQITQSHLAARSPRYSENPDYINRPDNLMQQQRQVQHNHHHQQSQHQQQHQVYHYQQHQVQLNESLRHQNHFQFVEQQQQQQQLQQQQHHQLKHHKQSPLSESINDRQQQLEYQNSQDLIAGKVALGNMLSIDMLKFAFEKTEKDLSKLSDTLKDEFRRLDEELEVIRKETPQYSVSEALI